MTKKSFSIYFYFFLYLIVGLTLETLAQTPDMKIFNQASKGYHKLVTGKEKNTIENWDKVISLFNEVIDKYPNNPKADVAQYSIGLCYLRQGKYREAIKSFNVVTIKYSNSNLADDSQYLIGFCYLKLQNIPNSISAFQKVVENYPEGDVYEKALQRISSLAAQSKYAVYFNKFFENLMNSNPKQWIVNNFSLLKENLQKIGSGKDAQKASRTNINKLERKLIIDEEIAGSIPAANIIKIKGIRVWSGPKTTRVVVDLNKRTSYECKFNDLKNQLFLNIPNSIFQSSKKSLKVEDGLIANVIIMQQGIKNTQVVFNLNEKYLWNIFSLEGPNRIVIDVSETISRKTIQPTAESFTIDNDLTLTQQLGLKVRTIIIDPGHGGDDIGASRFGIFEKDIVLDIALKLKKMLEDDPSFNVLLTRDNDVYVPLEERTAFANQHGGDIFISIHINASKNSRRNGVETYFLSLAKTDEERQLAAIENARAKKNIAELQSILKSILINSKTEESKILAETINKGIADMTKRKNNGIKQAPFVVLIGANMPSILTEVLFLSNNNENRLLKDDVFRTKIAESLRHSIIKYAERLYMTEMVSIKLD